ncbi:MAG: gamma-glutamyl-gamma-aminobutyrate hydrolase family protein [Gemmatimonadota bacterium]
MMPVIAVPTQTLQAIDGIPQGIPHSWVMNQRYFLALLSAGAAPFMVPLIAYHEAGLRALYESAAGIFLAGGVDIDPASYREDKLDVCGRTDPERDRVELLLTRWAMEDGKPVLGVCRGMQVINVACGGSLLQDVEHHDRAIKHDYFPTQGFERDYLAHTASVQPDSRLGRIYGSTAIRVNSMHHQGIRELGAGLTAPVIAPDGLIEGLESTADGFLVGVQWHPEMLIEQDQGTRRLFGEFVHAAGQYAARRNGHGAG